MLRVPSPALGDAKYTRPWIQSKTASDAVTGEYLKMNNQEGYRKTTYGQRNQGS